MEKMSVEEVRDVIESEGLDYAIMHYMSADNIMDETLRKYWTKAAEYLNKITDYVEENAKPELDIEEEEEEYD